MNPFLTVPLEVMDKEWPLWFVVLGFLDLGLIGVFVCMKKPAAAIIFVAWGIYGGIRQLDEINDPYAGPAIRSEAGLAYIVLSYLSVAASMVLALLGENCG